MQSLCCKICCGYGGASDVPPPIVQAIKLLTTHLYENREAVTSLQTQPYTIGALLQPYKVQRLNSILEVNMGSVPVGKLRTK